jgi:hypothetical protein
MFALLDDGQDVLYPHQKKDILPVLHLEAPSPLEDDAVAFLDARNGLPAFPVNDARTHSHDGPLRRELYEAVWKGYSSFRGIQFVRGGLDENVVVSGTMHRLLL